MNNFFSKLEAITDKAEVKLIIKSKDGIMSVLVLPKGTTISGTPAELDAGFIEAVIQPLSKSAGLIISALTGDRPAAAKEKTASAPKEDVKKAAAPKQLDNKKAEVAAASPGSLFEIDEDED